MTSLGNSEIVPEQHFCKTISAFGKLYVNLPDQEKVDEEENSLLKIVHLKVRFYS